MWRFRLFDEADPQQVACFCSLTISLFLYDHRCKPSIVLQALTLHTTLGQIKLELYIDHAPKACHNFLALCASGYYDDTKFHRNIKGFMLQGGDPTGTGRGGRCIFDTPNGKFEDEIVPSLKHDKVGVLSMANSGPNTNGKLLVIYCIVSITISALASTGCIPRAWLARWEQGLLLVSQ